MKIVFEKYDDGIEVLYQAEVKLDFCDRNFELDAGFGNTRAEALMDLSREIKEQIKLLQDALLFVDKEQGELK